MKRFRRVCAVFFAGAFGAASALAQTGDVAWQRAAHLQRGINTGIWFAQAPGRYTQERLEKFTTPDDLKLIAKLGFDHIRLSVDAVPMTQWENGQADGAMFVNELDRVVKTANEDGLAVIVDIHPEDPYKQTLLQGNDGVSRFALLWQAIARHFADADPNKVFFEIMNEPEQTDSYRWEGIESFVAMQIRAVAPKITIIAAAAHWDGLPDLLQFEPLPLENVIYTFHDYEPFPFTHQGATWTSSEVIPLKHVPYPSTPENMQANLEQEPTLAGQYFLEQYGLDRWNAERVQATIGFAKKWSDLHHVPVYCGEFGGHKPVIVEADRDRWLEDMRVALEKNKIGWAMWDYQTNFGIVTKADGKTTVDQGVVKALGLKPVQ